MNAREIVNRGVRETVYQDQSFSYTGIRDFKEEKPEILKMGPKPANPRPRSKASQNNSYS
jgi:hypothetical protein